jgi:hypothetical protein
VGQVVVVIGATGRRQRQQPFAISRSELGAIPEVCPPGIGVKIVKTNLAQTGQVVVAGERYRSVVPDQLNAFIRGRAIPYRITQAPQCVEGAGIGQDSLKSDNIRVYIRKNNDSHITQYFDDARSQIV